MAEWWRFDRSRTDEWKRTWTEIVSMSSAAAASIGLPQPGTLPGDPFAILVDAARAWLTGKQRTFRFSGHDLTLTLSDISVDGADLARVVGQYGKVNISARDVTWHVYQLDRIDVRASNVYVRPGVRLTLVTAPVHCEAFISASFASSWLAAVSPRLELSMVAGLPRVGVAGVPWVRLDVETGAEGRSIRLRPLALYLLDRRVSLWSPAFHLAVPDLPDGFMLTSIEPAPGGFLVRGLFSEWHRSLSRDDVERLLAGMRAGQDRLDI
ncbi:MAG: hypothetical protein ACLQK8_00505 [Streptosporangiaceae bacterium]